MLSFEPGTRIADRYELVAQIGAGGMGSVWTANQLNLEQKVAIKFIVARHDGREEVRARRFEREARAAARVQHPSLIDIKDYGLHDEHTPFLVMELLEGETLAQRIRREGSISVDDASSLCQQLGGALSCVHAAGIVHRDVKPENIFMVEAPGHGLFAKLLDFGVAKVESSETLTQEGVPGTRAYMSPEQLREQEVDLRSDLWSLGVVLYESLTGVRPFQGKGHALGEAIVAGELEPVSCVMPELPLAFDDWFAVAFSLSREKRFSSAKVMADTFGRVCRGQGWEHYEATGSPPRVEGEPFDDEPTTTTPGAERPPRASGTASSLEGSATAVATPKTGNGRMVAAIVLTAALASAAWFGTPRETRPAAKDRAQPRASTAGQVAATPMTARSSAERGVAAAPTATGKATASSSASPSPVPTGLASASGAPASPARRRSPHRQPPSGSAGSPPLYEDPPF